MYLSMKLAAPAPRTRFLVLIVLSLAALTIGRGAGAANDPAWDAAGTWNAAITLGGHNVPFRFEVAGSPAHPTGWFFNGKAREIASGGRYQDHHLVLDFGQYARRLDVTVQDGRFKGTYGPVNPASQPTFPVAPVSATRERTAAAAGTVPLIAGEWIVPAKSEKKDERAWRLIVRQTGDELSAAILRIDGDSGELTGAWRDGGATLSHFSGARPALLDLRLAADGTLRLVDRNLHGGADTPLTAYRIDDPRARALPTASDPEHHTRVRDPSVPFAFSFPDLNGRTVSNTDARFRHKVVVLDVSGSWCPNCHDEAPFLEELYRKYHDRGLEVVSLSFEEPAQLATLARLKTFISRYGLTYTVLVGGAPAEAPAKLPQAVDLDSWPTTFFIARDGRVRSVHTGFAAQPTGKFHQDLRQEFIRKIEAMLAEKS